MRMSRASGISELLSRAVSATQGPTPSTGNVVHLALSGGVDSSVAGLLLRERGWDVRPVMVRCWSDGDDGGEAPCFERELRAAEAVVHALRLPRRLSVFDFVPEYWTTVFDGVLLAGLARGLTPNQDLACNRFIKFGAFPRRLAAECGTDTPPPFATGHYARIDRSSEGLRLLTAVDSVKDQTYFLASVPGVGFANAIFPIGGLLKEDVRAIANHAGLPSAGARSSRGICFLGKRPMNEFLSQYIDTGGSGDDSRQQRTSGSFVLDGTKLGRLPYSANLYTIGQRARIGGAKGRLYVVGRQNDDVLLSTTPPVTRELVCDAPHWIGSRTVGRDRVPLGYKGNSSSTVKPCVISVMEDGSLLVRFECESPVVAPGQAVVFYDGEEVLGSAIVKARAS